MAVGNCSVEAKFNLEELRRRSEALRAQEKPQERQTPKSEGEDPKAQREKSTYTPPTQK